MADRVDIESIYWLKCPSKGHHAFISYQHDHHLCILVRISVVRNTCSVLAKSSAINSRAWVQIALRNIDRGIDRYKRQGLWFWWFQEEVDLFRDVRSNVLDEILYTVQFIFLYFITDYVTSSISTVRNHSAGSWRVSDDMHMP